jgi:hypothetical protein
MKKKIESKNYQDSIDKYGYKLCKLKIFKNFENTNNFEPQAAIELANKFFDTFTFGEGSFVDRISYNRALTYFTGVQISSILEYIYHLKYAKLTCDQFKIIYETNELSHDFKRIFFHNAYREINLIKGDNAFNLLNKLKIFFNEK